MPGTKTALVALGFVLTDAEQTLVEQARRLAEQFNEQQRVRFHGKVGTILGALERTIPPLLETAERVHGRDIEALVGPVTRIAKYIDASSEVILAPGRTYHVNHDQLADLLGFASVDRPSLENALGGLPGLTVITYPAHLAGDTLLHAVLAHEVAHIAYLTPLERGDKGEGARLIDASLAAHEEEFLKYIEEQGQDTVNVPLVESRARQRVKRWFLELACDRLAVALVGPSFAFALFDVEGPRHRWHQDHPSGPGYDTHPGLAWRLELAIVYAREWLPTHGDHPVWDGCRTALDELSSLVPRPRDALASIERQIIEGALGALDDSVVRQMLRVADYEPGVFRRDLPVVWDKLKSGIPPSEWIFTRTTSGGTLLPDDSRGWSRPIAWESILAGCYVYWLAGAHRESARTSPGPPTPIAPDAVEDWQSFNALVRGSIELSELQRALQASRESLNSLNPPTDDVAP
jgi:hypothetical protein